MPVALLLSLAIVTEVAGTVALRYSDGFTRLLPSVVVVVGYGVSFWLLALVLKELSIGLTWGSTWPARTDAARGHAREADRGRRRRDPARRRPGADA
jgi:hypothetical protein